MPGDCGESRECFRRFKIGQPQHAVGRAAKKGCDLSELTLDELRKFSALVEADIFDHIALDASFAARKTYGGTETEQVRAAIARAGKSPLVI